MGEQVVSCNFGGGGGKRTIERAHQNCMVLEGSESGVGLVCVSIPLREQIGGVNVS